MRSSEGLFVSQRFNLQGFSLVELLIVLALIGTSFTLGIPAIRNYQQSKRIQGESARVSMIFAQTRSRAASLNRIIRITFAPGTLQPADGFFVAYSDEDLDSVLDANEDTAAGLRTDTRRTGFDGFQLHETLSFARPAATGVGPLGGAIDADGVTFAGNQISFFPDGTASGVGEAVINDSYGHIYAVTVSAGGSARVYTWTAGSWK